MNKTDTVEEVDASFEKLLESAGDVDPKLRDMLQQKYESDHEEFSQAVKDAQPSDLPSYWSSDNCGSCYGRGTVGAKHNFPPGQPAKKGDENSVWHYANTIGMTSIKCKCTVKNYQNWLSEFRIFFNMLRAQTIAEAVEDIELEEGETDDTE